MGAAVVRGVCVCVCVGGGEGRGQVTPLTKPLGGFTPIFPPLLAHIACACLENGA